MVSDSYARFNDAHWLWSRQDPNGLLPGVGGAHHHWYGLGQVLLFVLPDWLLAKVGMESIATRYDLTSFLLFPLINGFVLMMAWRVLHELGYDSRQSSMAVLITVFCSTLLFHFQNNQENPLMLGLALTSILGILKWDRTGSLWWLNLACAAQAWNTLIRIPNLALVIPIFGLPFLARIFGRNSSSNRVGLTAGWGTMALVAVPWMTLGAGLDRYWHWVRFGKWTGTYMAELGIWLHATFSGLPDGYPVASSIWTGVFGLLAAPGRSVFLYEPLILLAFLWWIDPRGRPSPWSLGLASASAVAICGTIFGVSLTVYWSSEPNWGPRHLATPAHLLQLVTCAWLVGIYPILRSAYRRLLAGGIGFLMVLQFAGIWLPAFHETVVALNRQEPSYQQWISDRIAQGFPLVTEDSDWRIVIRAKEVLSEIALQLRDPERWASEAHAPRMLVPFRPLDSLPIPARWGVRFVWFLGLAVLVWIGRQSISSATVPKTREPAFGGG